MNNDLLLIAKKIKQYVTKNNTLDGFEKILIDDLKQNVTNFEQFANMVLKINNLLPHNLSVKKLDFKIVQYKLSHFILNVAISAISHDTLNAYFEKIKKKIMNNVFLVYILVDFKVRIFEFYLFTILAELDGEYILNYNTILKHYFSLELYVVQYYTNTLNPYLNNAIQTLIKYSELESDDYTNLVQIIPQFVNFFKSDQMTRNPIDAQSLIEVIIACKLMTSPQQPTKYIEKMFFDQIENLCEANPIVINEIYKVILPHNQSKKIYNKCFITLPLFFLVEFYGTNYLELKPNIIVNFYEDIHLSINQTFEIVNSKISKHTHTSPQKINGGLTFIRLIINETTKILLIINVNLKTIFIYNSVGVGVSVINFVIKYAKNNLKEFDQYDIAPLNSDVSYNISLAILLQHMNPTISLNILLDYVNEYSHVIDLKNDYEKYVISTYNVVVTMAMKLDLKITYILKILKASEQFSHTFFIKIFSTLLRLMIEHNESAEILNKLKNLSNVRRAHGIYMGIHYLNLYGLNIKNEKQLLKFGKILFEKYKIKLIR